MIAAGNRWKRQFATLWIGQAVSIFTSAVVQMSLIWYITYKTDSAAMLTLATLIGFVPRAIISAIGGVYIDRHSKKTIMLLADGFIALLSLTLAVAGTQMDIPVWMVLAILFGRSVGAAFHEPSLQAVTPLIVPRDKLTQYAGYAQGFQAISDLLSPSVAAVLYALFPIHIVILTDVAGAVIASALLLLVKIPHEKPEKQVEHKFLPEFRAGLHALRDAPGMAMLMVICALYAVIYSPIGTLFPLMSMSHFGGGVNGSALVETVFAAGTLAGAFLMGILGGRLRKVPAIAASMGLYGLGALVTGLLPRSGFVYFVIIAGIMGVSIPFYHGVRTSMLQMSFPAELLGRIMSLSMSIIRLAMPLGLILAGVFAETIGVDTWFSISGAFAMALALFTVRQPRLRGCCEVDKTNAELLP